MAGRDPKDIKRGQPGNAGQFANDASRRGEIDYDEPFDRNWPNTPSLRDLEDSIEEDWTPDQAAAYGQREMVWPSATSDERKDFARNVSMAHNFANNSDWLDEAVANGDDEVFDQALLERSQFPFPGGEYGEVDENEWRSENCSAHLEEARNIRKRVEARDAEIRGIYNTGAFDSGDYDEADLAVAKQWPNATEEQRSAFIDAARRDNLTLTAEAAQAARSNYDNFAELADGGMYNRRVRKNEDGSFDYQQVTSLKPVKSGDEWNVVVRHNRSTIEDPTDHDSVVGQVKSRDYNHTFETKDEANAFARNHMRRYSGWETR